jgi:5-methylcytosine-specific restriction enzyme A
MTLPCPQKITQHVSSRDTWMPGGPFYRSSQWLRLRALVLRAQPQCELCGAPSSAVDHVTPVRAGGAPLDPANVQALCQQCHSRKTASCDGGFGNRKADRPLRPRGCDVSGRPLDPSHPWHRR